jgi:hypothetical protein
MDYLYDRALTNKKMNREDRMLYEQLETRMQRAVKYADHHCRTEMAHGGDHCPATIEATISVEGEEKSTSFNPH